MYLLYIFTNNEHKNMVPILYTAYFLLVSEAKFLSPS